MEGSLTICKVLILREEVLLRGENYEVPPSLVFNEHYFLPSTFTPIGEGVV